MIQIKDIEHVLFHEIDNSNQVIMYLQEDQWCAYERSAYYLALEKPEVTLTKEVVREGYDVVLIKASFPMDDLVLPLSENLTLKLVADGRLQFILNERITKGFSGWKQAQLDILAKKTK